MSRRPRAQLEVAEVDALCQQRSLNRRQSRFDAIQSMRDAYNADLNFLPEESPERPYGVPDELDLAAFDVWCHVLEHVREPAEIRKLWEVSDLFRDILKGKYVEIMLPEIVALTKKKRPQYFWEPREEEDEDDDEPYEDDPIRHIDPIFQNLRLVSKQCKKSMEDIFYSNFVNSKYPQVHLKFRTPEILQMITDNVRGNIYNPDMFFPRQITLREDLLGFLFSNEAVVDFLRLAGHRIQMMHHRSFRPTAVIYNRLRQWVGLMPNLEVLLLSGMFGMREAPPRLADVTMFPSCPSLRRYDEGLISLPAPYVQRIVEANPHLQTLKLCEAPDTVKLSLPVIDALRNLTNLQCWPHTSILLSRNLPWKLTKMVFDDACTGEMDFPSRDVFPFLDQFKETLEYLEFRVNLTDFGASLDLPNVKFLKWRHHPSFENVNFILKMEHLKTFQLIVGDGFMKGLPASEKYKRIVGEESQSFLGRSIWDIFPNLDWIHLQTSNYAADEYFLDHDEYRKM